MNTNTLKHWLVKTPIFFAITSFLFAIVVAILCGLILKDANPTMPIVGIAITITTLLSAILAIRRLGIHKMDRTGLTMIFNTEMLILAIASFVSFITLMKFIPFQIWLYNLMQSTGGIIFAIILATCIVLASLYVFGLTIVGLWAKFLRARTMNIPLWKIICSIPFGFDMIWIPGYFLPNKTDKKPILNTNTNWILKLTNWTMTRPANAGLIFTSLIILTGLFSGISGTLLTLSMLMLFGIWAIQIGAKKFEKTIGNTYATTAVVINILIITYMILIAYFF
ncbi:MAG: hypothetical protein ACLRFP_02220 [Alphaproteobacteria bacterium]